MTRKFTAYATQYLSECRFEKAHSTFMSEKSKVKKLEKVFGKRLISEIRQSDIKNWKIKSHQKYSNKTMNEHFTILRSIFSCAVGDGEITINPMNNVENLPVHFAEPEPFEQHELIKLQQTEAACKSGKALVLLGVLTGLRISELIGLTWDCIDLDKAQLRVNKAKVLGQYKVPKTAGSIRDVELNRHAIELLKAQREETGNLRARKISVLQRDNKTKKTELVQHVFINTKTNKPFLHSTQFGKVFFNSFLKEAGVTHRGPGQLRHTFASQCLTGGISKEWIARQLGHNSTQMVDTHYARWLQNDAPDNSGKFSDAISSVFETTPLKTSSTVLSSHRSTGSKWAPAASYSSSIRFSSRPKSDNRAHVFSSSRCGGRSHA